MIFTKIYTRFIVSFHRALSKIKILTRSNELIAFETGPVVATTNREKKIKLQQNDSLGFLRKDFSTIYLLVSSE